MPRIPDSFIDELLTRADIVALVDKRVPLRKTGREYQALCPFHEEKTPSFTVSPQKQFYHCFGCGAHGTAIGFLMHYEGLDFPAAVEELAASVGLKVPRGFSQQHDSHAPLYEVLAEATRYYREQLKQTPEAAAYLKRRGLTGRTVEAYALGFAPDTWDGLLKTLGTDQTRRDALRQAGLLKQGKRGLYDTFRHRVLFPIRDGRGRVIAFGGRVLEAGEPKYLNSPETPLFHKGRALYGLFEARQGGAPETLVVVEGYMDVLALAQHGIPGAVATLGTATTQAHVERLFRTAADVVFCFDGDPAGRRAAWRALEASLPALRDGRQARFMFLPEGEDPDSLVQAGGKTAFQDRLDTATPLAEYLFEALGTQVDLTSLDGRARLVSLAKPLLRRLPEGSFRELAFERLAELARTRVHTLTRDTPDRPQPARPQRLPQSVKRTPVRMAIALLLQRPGLAQRMPVEDLRQVDLPGVDLLRELIECARERPHLNTAALLEAFRGHPAHPHLEQLAGWSLPLPDEGLEREFDEKLALIQTLALDRRLAALESKDRREGLTPKEKQTLISLMRRKARVGAEPAG